MYLTKVGVAIATMALVSGLSGTSPAQDTAASMLQAGNKKLDEASGKSGDERRKILKAAAEIYSQVPARFPDRAEECAKACLRLGRVFRSLDDVPQAIEWLEKAAGAPGQARTAADALFELSSIQRKERRFDKAKAALEQIGKVCADDPHLVTRAILGRASIARQERNYDEASALLRDILNNHADQWQSAVDALDSLVSMHVRQKKLAEAEQILAAHTDALKARYKQDHNLDRVEHALEHMSCHRAIKRAHAMESDDDDEKEGDGGEREPGARHDGKPDSNRQDG